MTLITPACFACTVGGEKKFNRLAGDVDVQDFCGKEESMGYRRIELVGDQWGDSEGNGLTYLSVVTISQRCIWITGLELGFCPGIKGGVKPLGLLLALRVLKCYNCEGLTGKGCW